MGVWLVQQGDYFDLRKENVRLKVVDCQLNACSESQRASVAALQETSLWLLQGRL